MHQPRYGIFRLFTSLHLLSKGRTIYCGPAKDSLQYFDSLGLYSLNTHLIGIYPVPNAVPNPACPRWDWSPELIRLQLTGSVFLGWRWLSQSYNLIECCMFFLGYNLALTEPSSTRKYWACTVSHRQPKILSLRWRLGLELVFVSPRASWVGDRVRNWKL